MIIRIVDGKPIDQKNWQRERGEKRDEFPKISRKSHEYSEIDQKVLNLRQKQFDLLLTISILLYLFDILQHNTLFFKHCYTRTSKT